MYLKSLVRVASVGALYRHKQEDSEPGPGCQMESPRTAAAAQSRQTVTQLSASYHHHQQSLIGEVTPNKIENSIVSLSTDQDADGENKRTERRTGGM